MKIKILLPLLLLLLLPMVASQEGHAYHMKLLAVQEFEQVYTGSEADLYLELKEGSGRVFLDTQPTTKIDTQISTRFAKEIACKHFKLPCHKYDFIFTIKARSNIVGGPSAGAAIAALTTIAVLDLPHDELTTITGTINSGGIVGPVGGVKEKLEAAAGSDIQNVMIAKGSGTQKIGNKSQNHTIELVTFGKENLSLNILEVSDIDEVVFHLTGKKLNGEKQEVVVNNEYTRIMQELQKILCSRTDKLQHEITNAGIIVDTEFTENIQEKKQRTVSALENKDYYSAASFCFGTNIDLRRAYYEEKKPSRKIVENLFRKIEAKTKVLETSLNHEPIHTISDLQALMIVKERLNDVKTQVNEYRKQKNATDPYDIYGILAYAEERFFSAAAWTEFFEMEGKRFRINQQALLQSCLQKKSEAEERRQYAELYIGPQFMSAILDKIATADDAFQRGDFELCLITASQAKADANAILSSLGLSEGGLQEFIKSKAVAVEKVISANSQENIFPILGYSYYQYALSLQEQAPYTALIYMEYALEMSDLSIYFPSETEYLENVATNLPYVEETFLVIIGFTAGILVAFLFSKHRKRTKKRRLKKKRVKRKSK